MYYVLLLLFLVLGFSSIVQNFKNYSFYNVAAFSEILLRLQVLISAAMVLIMAY